MSTISNEQAKDLRMAFEAWQQDYDPAEDKEQYEMFGLGIVAMDELLALRKEREKAETVAWLVCGSKTFKDRTASTREVAEQAVKDRKDGSCIKPLYTVPPAPTDKPKSEISQKEEQLVRDTTALAEKLSAETDTTAQQFESLAGKAVGGSEGWKLVPLEPTKEMVAKMRYHNGGYDKHIKNGYAAMLAVAPEPCK
ncbi:hypothetical protein ACI09C_003543 [Cronobacter turicensis]